MPQKTRKCQQCGLNRNTKFFTSRGRVCLPCQKKTAARNAKNRRLVSTYGITMAEYDLLLAKQGGKCAGCGGKRRILDVDHNHRVERELGSRASVRGLLCRSCNRILAYARDNSERLSSLSAYLNRPPAPSVLQAKNGEQK